MHRIRSRAFPSTSSSVSTATPFLVDRRPPPDLGKWANFKRFVWNREKRTFCNRTFTSWWKVILFYLIFLLLLNGLFFFLLLGATGHIRKHYKLPWIEKQSLIDGLNPGVAFLPNIIRINSPLLWYTTQVDQSSGNMKYSAYVNYMNDYFKRYDEAEQNLKDFSDCAISKEPNKPCIFLKKYMGPCGTDSFGYPEKKPCIYVKLNKLPEWTPEYFEGDDLPYHMPDALKKVIKAASDKKRVWVHCEGIFPPDDEHMGKVFYYPHQGIMGYYFPYTGESNYLTPLVAIKIDNIKVGYVVDIRCTVWAKNIKYSDYKTYSTDIHMYLAPD